MILLVTMDKGSMSVSGHYADQFASATRFVWQTQTSVRRDDLRGKIISGAETGWTVHLILRSRNCATAARHLSATRARSTSLGGMGKRRLRCNRTM
jgi:hypothetical protein